MAGFFDRRLMGFIYSINSVLVSFELVNGQW